MARSFCLATSGARCRSPQSGLIIRRSAGTRPGGAPGRQEGEGGGGGQRGRARGRQRAAVQAIGEGLPCGRRPGVGAVVTVQQPGPQPAGFPDGRFEPVQFPAGAPHQRRRNTVEPGRLCADGPGPGQHVPGQRARPAGVPAAKAAEPAEHVQVRQRSAKRLVELPALRGVELGAGGPDVADDDPGLQGPRHAAVAVGQHAVAEQPRHRQPPAGQESKRGDLACLPRAAIGQVRLEDRLVAHGEDLIAVLLLKQPDRSRAAEQQTCRGLNLVSGQPSMTHHHHPSQPERTLQVPALTPPPGARWLPGAGRGLWRGGHDVRRRRRRRAACPARRQRRGPRPRDGPAGRGDRGRCARRQAAGPLAGGPARLAERPGRRGRTSLPSNRTWSRSATSQSARGGSGVSRPRCRGRFRR